MSAWVVIGCALIGATPPTLAVLIPARKDRQEARAAYVRNALDHGAVVGHLSALRADVHSLRGELGRHIETEHGNNNG